MRMNFPTGSVPLAPKSSSCGELPMTATFLRYWTSVPLKNRPAIIGILVPSAKFSVVPNTTTGRVRRSR